MSLSSMTGFARTQGQAHGLQWTWEIKSVNGKGLDVRLRFPPRFDFLEIPARKLLGQHISRGSVQAFLELKPLGEASGIEINRAMLDELLDLAHELESGPVDRPRLDGLLRVRGVVEEKDAIADQDTRDALKADLLSGFEMAVKDLVKARQHEGEQMATVLTGLVDDISQQTADAASSDGARLEAVHARFKARLEELMGGDDLDQGRLEQEVATLAVKADVREELDRLKAHVESAYKLLAENGAVGRKLDFLSQEFNREANTLCSKAVDMNLKNIGLALKATIDQFREQLQNVE